MSGSRFQRMKANRVSVKVVVQHELQYLISLTATGPDF